MGTRYDRAWAVYELAAKALADAEARQRRLTHYANHPDVNRRLADAVTRAERAFDKAGDDLAEATRFEG